MNLEKGGDEADGDVLFVDSILYSCESETMVGSPTTIRIIDGVPC